MKILLYPKQLLETMWSEDKKTFSADTKEPPMCLRCGRTLNRRLVINPLSRYADVHICEACGADEAMQDAFGKPLPLMEWTGLSDPRSAEFQKEKSAVFLTPVCTFREIFQDIKKLPGYSIGHPVSEIVYSRSDYDGHQWWTTWHSCREEKAKPDLVNEIDQFQDALFKMKEFQTLASMNRLCRQAEKTSSSTEYNLYSETANLRVWLRMITRPRDYNLYVHFYEK